MDYSHVVDHIGEAVEGAGIAVIAIGAVIAAVRTPFRLVRHEPIYRHFRLEFGRSIQLGLELLVAGDIVRTVGEPTLTSVAILAIIVFIRTFLSFSLEVDLTGRWPWQKNTTPLPPE